MADSIIYGAGIIALTALCAAITATFVIVWSAAFKALIFTLRIRKAMGNNWMVKNGEPTRGIQSIFTFIKIIYQFTMSAPDRIEVANTEGKRFTIDFPGLEAHNRLDYGYYDD